MTDKKLPLTLIEYQLNALRTYQEFSTSEEALLSGSICLAGEVGEICNYIKKAVWHGHPLEREKLVGELGDVLWYLTTTAASQNISLEEVAEYNIAKLKRRYPNGFSKELSINRGQE